MNLEKAIIELFELQYYVYPESGMPKHEALKIGIEAIKQVMAIRKSPVGYASCQLLGETED